MDYPPPYVKLGAGWGAGRFGGLCDGNRGVGQRCRLLGGIRILRGTNEQAALNKILLDAFGRGLRYLTDQDARPAGSSSSVAAFVDSEPYGRRAEPVDAGSRAALKHFGENNIREGAPLATLEDVLVAALPAASGIRWRQPANWLGGWTIRLDAGRWADADADRRAGGTAESAGGGGWRR